MAEEQLMSDLVVVGGGPSALLFFLDLVRQGRLLAVLKDKGVTILESGRYFGSGHLEQYLVIGYSTGLDLFRLILKHPFSANRDVFSSCISVDSNNQRRIDMNLLDDFMQKNMLTGFKEVMATTIYAQLKNFALINPPLSAYGYYLRVVGHYFLKLVKSLRGQFIFRPYHEVQSISMQHDGQMNLRVKVSDSNYFNEQLYLKSPESLNQPATTSLVLSQNLYKTIKCRVIVLSIGSAQMSNFTNIRLAYFTEIHRELRLTSDTFLSDKGFTKAIALMQSAKKQLAIEKKKKRILIIGGAHSAFVCAVLLLKGPQVYNQGEIAYNGKNSNNNSSGSNIDVLSSFISKRNIDGISNGACTRCQMLQQRNRASAAMLSNYTSQNNSNNNASCQDSLLSVAHSSDYRGGFSQYANAQAAAAAPSLLNGSQYLQKRHGLSQIGISVLNQPSSSNLGMQSRARLSIGQPDEQFSLPPKEHNRYQYYQQKQQQYSQLLNNTRLSSNNNNNSSFFSSSNNDNHQASNYGLNSNKSLHNLSNNNISDRGSASSVFQGINHYRNNYPAADGMNSTGDFDAEQSECLCLGSIKPHAYDCHKAQTTQLNIQEGEIVILHRSPISLDCTKEEQNEQIYVHSVLGLKAGAKQLYKDIIHGREKRISLCQTQSEEKIKELIESSYAVIDASGYSSPELDIRGIQGEKITLQRDSQNYLKLDFQRRVMSDQGVLKNIFSVGFSSVQTLREEKAQLLNDYDTRTAGTGVIDVLQDYQQQCHERSSQHKFADVSENGCSSTKSYTLGDDRQVQPSDSATSKIKEFFGNNNNRSGFDAQRRHLGPMNWQINNQIAGSYNSGLQIRFTNHK